MQLKDRPRSKTRTHTREDKKETRWQDATKADQTGTIRRWLNLAKEVFDRDFDKDDPEPNAA